MFLSKHEPQGYHSVFTWFLYHGLRGEAAVNKDGVVTLGSLVKFVQEGINAAPLKRKQTLQHVFSPESLASQPLVVASSTAQPPTAQTLHTGPSQPKPPIQPTRVGAITKPSRMGCKLEAFVSPLRSHN